MMISEIVSEILHEIENAVCKNCKEGNNGTNVASDRG